LKPILYISIFFTLIINVEIQAQNFKVGIPVNKYLASYQAKVKKGNVLIPCEYVTFPVSKVTGVVNVLILDYVSSLDSIYVDPGHRVIKTGDTLYFTSSINRYSFCLQVKGEVKGKFYSIGTPEVTGEEYGCGEVTCRVMDSNPARVNYFYKENCIVIKK
jgi:hypothetical protein